MSDVDEYYDSILAYFIVCETDEGGIVHSIRDLSGRWRRALSTGGAVLFPADAVVRPLPTAIARYR